MPSFFSAVFAFILLAFLSKHCSCNLHEFRFNLEVDRLSDAASQVIRHFYGQRASALSLIQSAMQPFAHHKQSEIINRILLKTKTSIAYVIEEPEVLKNSPFLRTDAILFVDGYEAFRLENIFRI